MDDAKGLGVPGKPSPPVRLYEGTRWRRLFRRLALMVLPSCTCPAVPPLPSAESPASTAGNGGTIFTGTFYGRRNKRAYLCLQEHPKARPSLLLELPVLTSYLAVEMEDGILRLVLQCNRAESGSPVWNVPIWTAVCNGRKIGFAERKQLQEEDGLLLKSMEPVSAGAGMLPAKKASEDDPVVYLRAMFSRVVGSAGSESFHMIHPAGCTGQVLSIFMTRQ
ncbi:unnamed protein product [Victoria cruziana]